MIDAHGILIDRTSKTPLHRQLEAALRNAILQGQLVPGERVLSSRELQIHLGLSRNSILNALQQLHAEGYLITRRRVGTFVSAHAQRLLTAPTAQAAAPIVPSDNAARFSSIGTLALNLQRTAPFRPGVPALNLFPTAQFRRGFAPSSWTPELLDYDGPFGYVPLRNVIAQRLKQTRGMSCSYDDVIITGGAQRAFSLIAQILLNKGDVAIVEDPCYPAIRAVLHAQRARIVGARVDDSGIMVSSFEKRRAKVAWVTPSHQYPTTAVMSLERRFALLRWATKNDAWIVEDDYDSEFNYTNRPQPALRALDGGNRVIYVGTFSKVLSPALRVAYVVVPMSLRAVFESAHQVTGGTPSTILQAALARFVEDGYLGRHIGKMRGIYDERRRFVAEEFSRIAGAMFRVVDSRAGLHFIAELPNSADDTGLTKRALAKGLVLPSVSSYYYENRPRKGVVVGYAATSVTQARSAMKILSTVL